MIRRGGLRVQAATLGAQTLGGLRDNSNEY